MHPKKAHDADGPPACAGYFIRGRYVIDGRTVRFGLCNNKLALFDRRRMGFPVVNDLDLPGMGEIEGHYQPVRKPGFESTRTGQLRAPLLHCAGDDRAAWLDRHRRYAAWEVGMNRRNAWPADPAGKRQMLKRLFRAAPRRDILAFLHSFILKWGFLDGRRGFILARDRGLYYRMIASCRRKARD